MFYNNLISIPILIIASFAFEDWGAANLEQNLYCPSTMTTDTLVLLITATVFYSQSWSRGFHPCSSVIAQHGVCASPLQPHTGTSV